MATPIGPTFAPPTALWARQFGNRAVDRLGHHPPPAWPDEPGNALESWGLNVAAVVHLDRIATALERIESRGLAILQDRP